MLNYKTIHEVTRSHTKTKKHPGAMPIESKCYRLERSGRVPAAKPLRVSSCDFVDERFLESL